LKDNTQAWVLQGDGSYVRLSLEGKTEPLCAQTELLRQMAEGA
jgi:hypothetical protein